VVVRNEDDEPWKQGTVEEILDDFTFVRLDGLDYAGTYFKVHPLVKQLTHSLFFYEQFYLADYFFSGLFGVALLSYCRGPPREAARGVALVRGRGL